MLSEKEIEEAADAGADALRCNGRLTIGEYMRIAVRAALVMDERKRAESEAVRPPVQVLVCDTGGAEKPVESKLGWWFVDRNNPGNWYGPIEAIVGRSYVGRQCSCGAANWGLGFETITRGDWLRIPPMPLGPTKECREPKPGERWYAPDGGTLAGPVAMPHIRPHEHTAYGFRRWIHDEPARKAWPTTPAWVVKCNTAGTDDQIVWGVKDGNDAWLVYGVYKGTAEAACLALNSMPVLVTLARKTQVIDCSREWDTILARIDAAGFDLTKKE